MPERAPEPETARAARERSAVSAPEADTALREQEWNQAQLAQAVQRPAFRIWRYGAPVIVLGVSQRRNLPQVRARAGASIEVIARASGGGAVLTWPGLVSLSVVLPHGHPGATEQIHDSYRWLGEIHLRALAGLGVPARLISPAELRATEARRRGTDIAWACFGSLAPWEVTAPDGRKLAGFAQKRSRAGALLVAGTLVTPPDWSILANPLQAPQDTAGLSAQTASAGELAGRPIEPDEFARALECEMNEALESDLPRTS